MTQNLQFSFKIFDVLPLYGILFDHDGTVITANKTFLNAIGLREKEIIGMSAEELEPYYVDLKKHLTELEAHGVRTVRGFLVKNDGTRVPVEHTFMHIAETEREIVASISYKIEGRTIGEERREAEKKIEAANQRKRQFVANINHEIRTPMNAIVGYAEMLAELDMGTQQRHYVETIRKNSAHLIAIINDIMELSKLETGNVRLLKSTVNLHSITEQVCDVFADQAKGKNLEFICQVDPDLPKYYIIDVNHCRQILTNLISNAVKYTDAGKITLSVSGEKKKAAWYMLTFSVLDTGRGMTVQEQNNILDLIAQQKESVTIHDGKCLGLTLSARLARIMGGDIFLESAKGKGTTFSFTLLASVTDEPTFQGVGSKQRQRKKEKRKKLPVILVVDDMPEMSHLVKIYFTGTAIRVLEASNREKCLEHAFNNSPDLILMDLNLAGTDGRDITRQLRDDPRTKQIPVIAMTGMMLEKKTYKPLFDDFLAKPFHLHELRSIVDKYIPMTLDTTVCAVDEPEDELSVKPAKPVKSVNIKNIRPLWTEGLDELYRQAEMSGSLDIASELGQKMQEQGLSAHSPDLLEMGKKMRQFALDLDIQGVDHLLAVLETIARKDR
ncbi:MAG: ATP-binding protein [Candidatus Electrothrix sp. Rat3]|nr:ATP-binding protein [Candidatus Electrothrix rattekaaiensis]